jgi:hypothetical protein
MVSVIMPWTPIIVYILVETVGFALALGVLATFADWNRPVKQLPKAAAAGGRPEASDVGRVKDDAAKAAASDKAEVQDGAVPSHNGLTWLLHETLHILHLDAWIPAKNKVPRRSSMQYECHSGNLPYHTL